MTDHKKLIEEARRAAPGDDPTGLAVQVHRLADALEAATPVETEWEYGHEGDTLIGVHANASREHAIEDAARLTGLWETYGKRFRAVRRRKAGPWLPVEGENE